jgi:single-stranded-DNA-specific exonuclease
MYLPKVMPKDIEKRWVMKSSVDSELVHSLSNSLSIDPVIATILIQRGIQTFEEARGFFRPNLNELHDPFLMKDMDRAIARIEQAIEKKERILVYGDYDVDGTTAVALMYGFLHEIYPHVSFYIPDRYAEGYGISFKGIDFAADNDFGLIIALDCGIKSNDKADYALEKGIDFIICDHHNPGEIIPNAIVLDPKRKDCHYPFKELSGCGIGFKVIQALAKKKNISDEIVNSYLDLVTISTAADIVPIHGENRTLAYFGLKEINSKPRPGIEAMLNGAGKKLPVDISDLVFVIGPRINAAGRIHSGQRAVELLIAKKIQEAYEKSEILNEHNDQRKNLDKEITAQALAMIAQNPNVETAKTTVLYYEDWHKGVIGIVASRVIETYYRPTIMLTGANGKITGSARSVKDYDVYEAIEKCSGLLEQFGGHKYAAGLTMKIENLDAFIEKFETVVSENITDEILTPKIEIDAEIFLENIYQKGENTNEIPKFYRVLKQMGPFGPGNMSPVFVVNNLKDAGYSKIVGESHLKLYVSPANNPELKLNGIAFGLGHLLPEIQKKTFNLAFSFEENFWNDKSSLQLAVKDIKIND